MTRPSIVVRVMCGSGVGLVTKGVLKGELFIAFTQFTRLKWIGGVLRNVVLVSQLARRAPLPPGQQFLIVACAMEQSYVDRLRIVNDELWENRDYFTAANLTKAEKWINAAEAKIDLLPQSAGHGGAQGEEIRQDINTLYERLVDAKNWLRSQRAGSRAGFRLRGMTRQRLRYQGSQSSGEINNQS